MKRPSSHPRHEHVERYLLAVEVHMRAEIARTPAAWPARTLLDAGGKRLRARLLWWSACATATTSPMPENDHLVRAGAAIEFAHLASLIHDDIVDGGESRRGVVTVHRQHGLRSATEAGAVLAHLASGLVATLRHPARRVVRRAILATCRGQVRELAAPFVRMTPRTRLTIMQEKTAAFFELAAALGAIIGGADRRSEASVRRFARRFGVAFQIADDLLDLTGDPLELGRENGSDLRDGVLTLPVLLAADQDDALTRALAQVRSSPDTNAIAECARLIASGSGIHAATAVARWWLESAHRALRSLTNTSAIDELMALSEVSVTRGLRLGSPSFLAPDLSPAVATSDLADSLRAARDTEKPPRPALDRSLTTLLEWFYPGLTMLLTEWTQDPAVASDRLRLRNGLLQYRRWSREAETAADAIALGRAITATDGFGANPARALPLVDALHCASIAILSGTSDWQEHLALATRARDLSTTARSTTARPAPLGRAALPFQAQLPA